MDIITRKQAREQGLTRYFTGKPCKHGNLAERGVTSPYCLCRDCRDERNGRGQVWRAAKQIAYINTALPTGTGGKQFSSTQYPPAYYTYAYLRENGTPWYIGKGTARRAWDKHGNPHTKKTWRAPSNDRILILKWNLSEEAAHTHETYLIGLYGNAFVVGGLLTRNFTAGGEGCSGRVTSEETKAKIGRANAGRPRPQHLRDRISRSLTGRTQPRELVERRRASRQGYRHAPEVIAKIGATNRATKLASDSSARKAADMGIPHDAWQVMSKQDRKHAAKYKERAAACGYTLVEWLGMSRGERCSASKRRYFSQLAA